MSLSKDMRRAGTNLNSEEKLMASFIKYEQIFKKYKFHLLIILLIVAGFLSYSYINATIEQNNLKKANEAFLILQKDPSNENALSQLKQHNQKLYQLFMVHKKLNEKDFDHSQNYTATAQVSDIASYHKSLRQQKLTNYDGMYNDLANLIEGYHLLKNSEHEKAKLALSKIPQDSQLSQNVKILMHYANSEK